MLISQDNRTGLSGVMRMLLRRVMNHLRKQEWTAIGIDFRSW